jgi:hypothetical protein
MSPIVRFASPEPACALNRRPWPLALGLWPSLCLALLLAGCSKSPTPNAESDSALRTSPSALLKFHWLGKQRLATEANATNFMAIWNLPESAKLEAQTLDKLATAPWRLWQTNVAVSNAPTALLRPLLDDLVQHEVYVEATGATNQPGELVLAIRLPADRAALWETNLPQVLTALSSNPDASVPSSIFHLPSADLSMSRSGDWTLLSARLSTNSAQPATLLESFRSRLAATQSPYALRATNYLVELQTDLPRLNEMFALGLSRLAAIEAARLVVFGDGENLRLRGGLDFAQPLKLRLDPWQVPTNLIQSPLIGFTALRGVATWLESLDFWRAKQLGAAPDQIYFWSQKSAPWLHFFAARSPAPTPQFLALKDYILDTVNPLLALNRTGDFAWATNESKVVWKGVPFCSPTFALQEDLIIGGFVAVPPTRRPMPPEFLQQLQNGTNLVYYDWELTGEQISSWTQIGQLMRMAFSRAQLSIKDAGLPWLNTVGTNLAHSATTVTLNGDRQLVFARAATLGLNSVELQLFTDWLDSPDFPRGLHTFDAPREYVTDRTRPPGMRR